MEQSISLAEYPRDMLVEIRNRLDTTSMNLWRIADPAIARRFFHRRPRFNWTNRMGNFLFGRSYYYWYRKFEINNKTKIYMDCLHQAVFDDHQGAFNYYYGKNMFAIADDFFVGIDRRPYYDPDNVDRSLCYAALMGGATVCWDFLSVQTRFYEIDKKIMIAAGNNQQLFIQNKLNIDLVSCLKQLYNDRPKQDWKPRGEMRRKPAVVEMVRHNHWQQVDWFVDGVMIQGWELDCHIIKLVLMNCVAYGNIGMLEKLANLCNKDMLVYAVANGVTDNGIKWLEEKFPKFLTYFKDPRNCKKALNQAAKRGHPKVLQWLFDRGYANVKRDGITIVDQIRSKKFTRTKNWFKRLLTDEDTATSRKLLENPALA